MKTGQQGFAVALVIIIIAAIGIGGGVYYSQKVKGTTAVEDLTESEQVKADESADSTAESKNSVSVNTQANTAVSGTIKMNVTLQELLAYNKGKNVMCHGASTTSEGTVTSTAYMKGEMVRGDTVVVYKGTTTKSSMIMKDEIIYSWTGNQGVQIAVDASFDLNTILSMGNSQNKPAADQKAEYSCSPWIPDSNKFIVPTSVQFTNYGSVAIPSISPEMMQKMMEGKSGY